MLNECSIKKIIQHKPEMIHRYKPIVFETSSF